MNNENVKNKDVLCLWSCTTSCRYCRKIHIDIIIQQMLLKINITLFNKNKTMYIQVEVCIIATTMIMILLS